MDYLVEINVTFNSFRLTIRNVNEEETRARKYNMSSFRLTIRNVNSKLIT